jgi:hypothetical protein
MYVCVYVPVRNITFESSGLLLQKSPYSYVNYGRIAHVPTSSFLPATVILKNHVGSSGKTPYYNSAHYKILNWRPSEIFVYWVHLFS